MRRKVEVEIWASDGLYTFEGEVVTTGSSISVSYVVDGEYVVYKGKEVESSHYRLVCTDPEILGHASLHRFSDGELWEGSWRETASGWDEGMWRFKLPQP